MTGQRIADLEQWIADLEHQAVELAAEVAKLTRAIRRAIEVIAAIDHTTEQEGAGK